MDDLREALAELARRPTTDCPLCAILLADLMTIFDGIDTKGSPFVSIPDPETA